MLAAVNELNKRSRQSSAPPGMSSPNLGSALLEQNSSLWVGVTECITTHAFSPRAAAPAGFSCSARSVEDHLTEFFSSNAIEVTKTFAELRLKRIRLSAARLALDQHRSIGDVTELISKQ